MAFVANRRPYKRTAVILLTIGNRCRLRQSLPVAPSTTGKTNSPEGLVLAGPWLYSHAVISTEGFRMEHRIGIGHDTHRLEPGRQFVLGGVEIPHEKGCVAHSDGDVLLHALTDAILGALAWGDIGEWFPDTDPSYQGADSQVLLRRVLERVFAEAWQVANVDCILFAQRPKLSQLKPTMRARLAEILQVTVEQVSVKAKTGEKVGPIGREEAVSAEVIVLLQRTE